MRAEVASCDALLFVKPKYNCSIPGALKKATDIGLRPQDVNVFDGLPAAIVSVTSHTGGAAAANHALHQSFAYINLALMQQPEAYIGEVNELVDEHGQVAVGTGENCFAAS